jgi:hypothetical protein
VTDVAALTSAVTAGLAAPACVAAAATVDLVLAAAAAVAEAATRALAGAGDAAAGAGPGLAAGAGLQAHPTHSTGSDVWLHMLRWATRAAGGASKQVHSRGCCIQDMHTHFAASATSTQPTSIVWMSA